MGSDRTDASAGGEGGFLGESSRGSLVKVRAPWAVSIDISARGGSPSARRDENEKIERNALDDAGGHS